MGEATVQFFNSTRAHDLLLEGAVVAGVPATNAQRLLGDFPRGFHGRTPDDAMDLVKVLSSFVRGTNDTTQPLSCEIRQTLVKDTRDKRILRKSLVINGSIRFTSQRRI